MWGDSAQECKVDCQCSGLITDSFTINSGNNATKRRRDEAAHTNFKLKMSPNLLKFDSPRKSPTSPLVTPKRRILGENLLRFNTSPNSQLLTPKRRVLGELQNTTYSYTTKVSKVFEERKLFKMSKQETSYEYTMLEDSRHSIEGAGTSFGGSGRRLQKSRTITNWTLAKLNSTSPVLESPKRVIEETSRDSGYSNSDKKLHSPLLMDEQTIDFSDMIQSSFTSECEDSRMGDAELFVPQNEPDLEQDLETLHDLEEEFDSNNFDQCSKYEIVSTDSPDIISRGRSRKISTDNFVFGAPISDSEQSTSFNRPSINATRMLNFDEESFEFTSPAIKKSSLVKKSLKFSNQDEHQSNSNALTHEKSDSSIGSMSTISPVQRRLRLYPSESSTSMESGFISEMEEFLDLEDQSNSPKVANFSDLLSGQIKDSMLPAEEPKRPVMQRSLSYNPDPKARVSLFSILESPEKRPHKRPEPLNFEDSGCNKRRKSNCDPIAKVNRPVLQRAYSENAASIMSALARSSSNPNLIGDFSLPFALPLTAGQHSDLKSISSETLAGLLRGEYRDSIKDFQVIDCRYPYEYRGGHIKQSQNLYTTEQVLDLVNRPLDTPEAVDAGRSILVFHCEFSQERGPKLSRFLRLSDRDQNKENYPNLRYPEVYLLHEGYKAFFSKYPDLCEPCGYVTMLDPIYKKDLEIFRSNSERVLKKSVSMDERRTLQRQKSRSRLLL